MTRMSQRDFDDMMAEAPTTPQITEEELDEMARRMIGATIDLSYVDYLIHEPNLTPEEQEELDALRVNCPQLLAM